MSKASEASHPTDKESSDVVRDHASAIDFATFVESLAQEALVHMGVLPHPETSQTAQSLPLAQQSIDILRMLQVKTQGNLDDAEKKLVDAVLHDLRLLFVQRSHGH